MLFRCYLWVFGNRIIDKYIVVFNVNKNINYDFGNDFSVFVNKKVVFMFGIDINKKINMIVGEW